MTDGKYEITGEFLEWAEENYHMLKNSKMIGGKPDITKLSNGDLSDQTQAEAYGFSCFDGTDGIICKSAEWRNKDCFSRKRHNSAEDRQNHDRRCERTYSKIR